MEWNIGIYNWWGSGAWNPKLVVDAPTGSTQVWTQRIGCPDAVYEQTVDYQPDGIHLVQTHRDSGERPWADPAKCGTGVALPQACRPIPAPLILPSGAKPGQHLDFTMACAPESVHRVSIDVVGWKKVMIRGKPVTTLVVRTRDDITSASGTWVYSVEDWVMPGNGLLVFERSRLFSDNVYGFMTAVWEFRYGLSTCSTCADQLWAR